MLESNLSAMWGFAGEWCLVGTAPFLHLMRDAWCSQNITPLVKPSVKLRGLGQSPICTNLRLTFLDMFAILTVDYCGRNSAWN